MTFAWTTSVQIRFGDCSLDPETRELRRSGKSVHVSPKAFQLLEILVERRPKAVSKEELHKLLWPKTFVADTTLTGLVAELRSAIGDSATSPRFIRTVRVYGYAFAGPVRESSVRKKPAYFHRLFWGNHEIPLEEGENVLGRGPETVAVLENDTISRRHARIRISGASATLEDLGSKNGTFLGGEKVSGSVALTNGDEISLGSVSFRFRTFRGAVPTATATSADRGGEG